MMLPSSMEVNQGPYAIANTDNEDDPDPEDVAALHHLLFEKFEHGHHPRPLKQGISNRHVKEMLKTFHEVNQSLASQSDSKRTKNHVGYAETARIMNERHRYGDHITPRAVKYYATKEAGLVHGLKSMVAEQFERELALHLIFLSVNDMINNNTGVPNTAFSHEEIEVHANVIRAFPRWRHVDIVAKLEITPSWTESMLSRWGFTIQKIIEQDKQIVTQDEVNDAIRAIQNSEWIMGFKKCNIVSICEDSIIFNSFEYEKFAPFGLTRANTKNTTDTRKRIIVWLGGSAAGDVLPAFIMFQNRSHHGDQPYLNLFSILDSSSKNEYEERIWVHGEFRRNYLINRIDGSILTTSLEFWSDQVSMMMYIDLILGPYKRAANDLVVILNDDPMHQTDEIKDRFSKNGIIFEFLPKYCKPFVSPADSIIHQHFKRSVVENKMQNTRKYLESWRIEYALAFSTLDHVPIYHPPPIEISQVLKFITHMIRECDFKDKLVKEFERVGLAPKEDGTFNIMTISEAENQLSDSQIGEILSDIYKHSKHETIDDLSSSNLSQST